MSRSILTQYGLSSEQMNKCENYSSFILRWNERIQLTATRDRDVFLTRHVVDCLELASDMPEGRHRLIDVGSGGGLPGIVLAIARPDIEVTVVEPTRKKHAFLSAARRELALQNLQTKAVRVESLTSDPEFHPYDLGVARAVWAVDEWLRRAPTVIRPGGVAFAMEGRQESELPEGCQRRRYTLPDGHERAIIRQVVVQPSSPSEHPQRP